MKYCVNQKMSTQPSGPRNASYKVQPVHVTSGIGIYIYIYIYLFKHHFRTIYIYIYSFTIHVVLLKCMSTFLSYAGEYCKYFDDEPYAFKSYE